MWLGPILPLWLLYLDPVHWNPGSPYVLVCGTNQCDGHPTLDVSARLIVGLLPFFQMKLSMHLSAAFISRPRKPSTDTTKGEKWRRFWRQNYRYFKIILLLCHMETLLRWLVPVREGVSVNDTHLVNTVSASLTEVMDDKASLLIWFIWSRWWVLGRGYHRMSLYLLHGKTLIDEGVVAHIRGGEIFSWKVRNPITELVVTSHEYAALLTIQVVKNGKMALQPSHWDGRYGGSMP